MKNEEVLAYENRNRFGGHEIFEIKKNNASWKMMRRVLERKTLNKAFGEKLKLTGGKVASGIENGYETD